MVIIRSDHAGLIIGSLLLSLCLVKSSVTAFQDNIMKSKSYQPAENKKATSQSMRWTNCTHEEQKVIAASVGVRPPTRIPRFLSRQMFRAFKRLVIILHTFDPLKPPNSSLSLMCLWWKTIAANDQSSPAYDGGLTYDLLPRYCRWMISPWLVKFYPRLTHCNIEIRTAFLDRAVTTFANEVRKNTLPSDDNKQQQRIRLVTFGGGYDVRSMKLMEQGIIDEAVELDLPIMVQAKRRLFESKRFRNKRPNIRVPTLYELDLNNLDDVRTILQEVIKEKENFVTIFLFEGVLMYLNDGISHELRLLCNHILQENQKEGYLCLADRLETVTDNDVDSVRSVLAATNWQLVDFLAKPGAARHMASARLLNSVGTCSYERH
jgi:hypothetical protein